MKEYTERVADFIGKVGESSSYELFSLIESEINSRITVIISNKKVYGSDLYTSRIKIDGVVLCSEYNVLKANYSFLLFAVKIIKEKILLEKMTALYKNVVNSAVNGLTKKELEGICVVLDSVDKNSGNIVISDISKKYNITRSIIINGLKKLECAGIIEMYSKGVGGTNIKLLYSGIRSVVSNKRRD